MKKILHIEDKEEIYESLKHSLEDFAEVENAPTHEDAEKMIQKFDYDLCICDGTYPLKKGCIPDNEAWKKTYNIWKETNENKPLIVFSGSTMTNMEAEEKGIKSFKKKDVSGLEVYIKNLLS